MCKTQIMRKFLILIFLICLTDMVIAQDDKILLANEYYNNGDIEKAKELYDNLSRRQKNIPRIHNNYLDLLTSTGDFKKAEIYIKRAIKLYPNYVDYNIDLGMLYKSQGREDAANKYFDNILERVEKRVFNVQSTAQSFMRKRVSEYAVQAFKIGRKINKKKYAYALELANVYRITNNKELMIEEYLNYIKSQPENVDYVKNVLQNILSVQEDLVNMETYLYDKVQEHPNEELYTDLLIWVNLQLKKFNQAFIQSRAYDKRFKTGGNKTFEVGIIAFENKAFKNAIKIFEYIVDQFSGSNNYLSSKKYLIKSREEMVKTTYPIDTAEIRKLIVDYDALVDQVGSNTIAMEIKRSEALLYAFYLDQKNKAIEILNDILKTPRLNSNLAAKSKLDLGDIHLLIGEPWESTLLYSQVEKEKKTQPLGYEAKLKNAKLSYYNGNFSLAQSHLDILKLATSREIANDALQLSLLIKDNTILDTTDVAMKTYASIDLLLFQNKRNEAIEALDKMLVDYAGHRITDEIYWLKAQILIKLGKFQESLEMLNLIVEEYPYDILSDDAYYLIGQVYEEQLSNAQEAMNIYQDFLTKYPGSIFTSEARKRFRKLRGDTIN